MIRFLRSLFSLGEVGPDPDEVICSYRIKIERPGEYYWTVTYRGASKEGYDLREALNKIATVIEPNPFYCGKEQ